MGFTTRRRVSIPPPLISQIASVFRNHEASPPNQEALIGATARLIKTRAADTPKFIYGEEAARPPFC